jgi:hypothetical protein
MGRYQAKNKANISGSYKGKSVGKWLLDRGIWMVSTELTTMVGVVSHGTRVESKCVVSPHIIHPT